MGPYIAHPTWGVRQVGLALGAAACVQGATLAPRAAARRVARGPDKWADEAVHGQPETGGGTEIG